MKNYLQTKGGTAMKRLGLTLIVLTLFLFLSAGIAWAQVTLPQAIIGGEAKTTAATATDPGSLTTVDSATNPVNYTRISRVVYLDGSDATSNGATESIIGAEVVILGATRTGPTAFTDALIEIRDPNNPLSKYFTASLTNIVFTPLGSLWYLNVDLNSSNPATLNLESVSLSEPSPSRFISELQSVLPATNKLGMKMGLLFLFGDITGNGSADIGDGVIDGSPPQVEPPAGARTIGYWKNHDEEREAFIFGSLTECSAVFGTGDAGANTLRYDLTKKGKKSMIEKAKQQLAALCLNVSASLDLSTVLTDGECEILNQLTGATCPGPTVDDALTAIIDAINDGVPDNDEDAKDLADEINNRDNS